MESSSEFLLLFKLPEQTKSRQRRQVPRAPAPPAARAQPGSRTALAPRLPPPPQLSIFSIPPQPRPRLQRKTSLELNLWGKKKANYNLIQGGGVGVERERNISQIIISGRCTSLFGFPRLSLSTSLWVSGFGQFDLPEWDGQTQDIKKNKFKRKKERKKISGVAKLTLFAWTREVHK